MNDPSLPSVSISISTADFSGPASLLIQKISDAIGVFYEPTNVRRLAKAYADAKRIAAQSELAISDLHRRAIARWINEEAQNQANIENVVAKAIPYLEKTASPDQLDNDWLRLLFDRARLVTAPELQELWAKVLAREANQPTSVSVHAIHAIASMDRSDAQKLARACQLVVRIDGEPELIVMSGRTTPRHVEGGPTYAELQRLEELALVRLGPFGSSDRELPDPFEVAYGDHRATVRFTQQIRTVITGYACFTSIGWQMFHALPVAPLEGVWAYLREHWANQSHLEIVSWDE